MKDIMTRAWEIMRELKISGRMVAECMKQAWKEYFSSLKEKQIRGTEKQVSWAEKIRKYSLNKKYELEDFIEELQNGGEEEYENLSIAEYKELLEAEKNRLLMNTDAVFWIETIKEIKSIGYELAFNLIEEKYDNSYLFKG